MNNTLRDPDKITMTHTGLLPGKKGKLIHVSFERKTERGRDFAELVLPSRNVLSSKGFDDGELVQLQLYLKSQEKDIILAIIKGSLSASFYFTALTYFILYCILYL